MKIVFASHSPFNPRLVVGSHHFSRILAQQGHQVLHVSAPLTVAHFTKLKHLPYRERIANWLKGGTSLAPNLTDYVPLSLIPWQVARKRLTETKNPFVDSMVRFRSVMRRHGFLSPDLLLIDEPRFVGIQKMLEPQKTYYRATDLYADIRNDPLVKEAERILVGQVDGIIGTSGPVIDWLRSLAPQLPSLLLENGVPALFHKDRPAPKEYENLPRPRAVYVGALDERFDFLAIEKLATARRDASIILIGPVSKTIPAVFKTLSNVHLLGVRGYDAIPPYLQHADVGLLPFNEHAANRGRSPMKLYEYAASGLPVVSAATEEVTRRAEPFVFTYPTADGITEAMHSALASDQFRELAREAARERSWDRLTGKLLDFCR